MPIEIKEPTILFVEGKDEVFFFNALITHLGLKNIQILDMEGKTQFRDRLRALINSSGFRAKVASLGIVRDANANPKGTFQSVCDALKALNLPVPKRSLVPEGIKPKVTILILPKEDTPGMLEDICLKSVQKDPALFCVDQYFKCLQEEGIPLSGKESKAKVQAFLASRKEPGLRLGEAAQKGYWPWENNAFEEIKKFLHQIVL
jgi:hypothetical protein